MLSDATCSGPVDTVRTLRQLDNDGNASETQ